MARSIEQIYQEILLAKDAEPLLKEELTTKPDGKRAASRTAIWQLWCYVFAVAAHSFEKLWDLFRKDIDDIISARRLGTPEWYVSVSKDFQYGGDVKLEVLEDGTLGFTTESKGERVLSTDEDKKIITRASFRESRGDGLLILKVAGDEDGVPVPLEEDAYKAFEIYIDRIKFAGTYILIISTKGDQLRYEAEVFYDSTEDKATLEKKVKDAIYDYVSNLPFDGVFVKNDIIKRVREVDGISDIVFKSLRFNNLQLGSDPNGALTEESYTPQVDYVNDRVYETSAGYIDLKDDESQLTLISTSETFLQ